MNPLRESGTAAIGAGFMATMVMTTVLNCTSVPAVSLPHAYPGVPRLAARSHTTAIPPAILAVTSAISRDFSNPTLASLADRPTTPLEQVVGEIRSYGVLGNNWDGEGAARPNLNSIRSAVAFVRLLDPSIEMPEPMLFASGRAGLFWNNENIYADLEFTEAHSITYFVERQNEGKHKGVVVFEPETMPGVLAVLLSA